MSNRRLARTLAYCQQLLETRSRPTTPRVNLSEAPKIDGLDLSVISESLVNQTKSLHILPESTIETIVEALLGTDFAPSLQKMGLSSPSVDYISYYETFPLPDPAQSVYANHWHTDDTLRPSAVKYFYLPHKLGADQGAMQYLSLQTTQQNWQHSFYRGAKLTVCPEGEPHEYCSDQHGLLLAPHWTLHRAGVPAAGQSRKMMVVQLNNRKRKTSVAILHERQALFEPTLMQEWGLRRP